MKARKDGLVGRVLFSDAQAQHLDAFEEALKRRYYKITEAEQRKLLEAQREASKDIAQRAERQAGMTGSSPPTSCTSGLRRTACSR